MTLDISRESPIYSVFLENNNKNINHGVLIKFFIFPRYQYFHMHGISDFYSDMERMKKQYGIWFINGSRHVLVVHVTKAVKFNTRMRLSGTYNDIRD